MLKPLSAGLALLALCVPVSGYTRTPPNANTGRPGEITCANCHEGATASQDSTRLLGLPPDGYRPDSTYRLRLSVRYRGMKAWGFEITCADSANQPAGSFLLTDTIHTQLGFSRGFSYVKQTGPGAHKGKPDSCSWRFAWRAPPAGTGRVTFYWDALPCNNDGGALGDVDVPGKRRLAEWSPPKPAPRRHIWHYPHPETTRAVIVYRGRTDLPLRIFSADGRLAGRLQGATTEQDAIADWPGLDSSGAVLPAGDYFIELGPAVDTVIAVYFVRRRPE